MNVVNYALDEQVEIRVKPIDGAYCELHVIDNCANVHVIHTIDNFSVKWKSEIEIDEIVGTCIKKMIEEINSRKATLHSNMLESNKREELHKFWTNA